VDVDCGVNIDVLSCNLFLLVRVNFVHEIVKHCLYLDISYVHVFLVRFVVKEIFHFIVDFLLPHFGLLAVQNDVLHFVRIFFLLLEVHSDVIEGVDGLHIHHCLLELELLVDKDLLSKNETLDN
jgi:hypothetical protein